MPNTYTTNLNLTLPQVGGDTDAWGTDLNNDLTTLDGIFASNGTGTSIGLNVGSGKTLAVGGVLSVTGSSSFSSPISVSSGGSGTSTAFTAGSVVFAGASGVYSQNNGQLFWDSTNNRLGIGTGSPASKLDIVATANNAVARIISTDSTRCDLRFQTSGSISGLFFGNSTTFDSGRLYYENTNSAMVFYTNSSERMRINSSGNVGIGTSSPSTKLNVVGAQNAPSGTSVVGIGRFQESSGGNCVEIGFNYVSGVSNYGWVQSHDSAGASAYYALALNPLGGNVGIGTSSPNSPLHVNGSANLTNQTYAYFALSGTSASTGYASGQTINVSIYASDRVSATEFDARSDGRLKNVIAEIPAADALKFIQDVKPVHYRWKDPASGGDKFGFIAQDVIKAGFANLIGQYPNENLEEETDADGFVSPKGIALTVNYDQVIPILSAAIKELAAEVAALKAKVGA